MSARAVLVDLDGTLVDSAPDIVAAAGRLLRALGAPPLSPDTVTGFIGNGVPTLVRRVLAAAGLPPSARALALFDRHYAETNGRASRVFPGVLEGLAALRAAGYQLGCVTNKPQAAAAALLSSSGLTPFFDIVVGGDATAHMKPHAAPLLHACRLLGADTARSVLVGDSHVDVAAARAAPMPAYIVRYGYPGPGGHAAMHGVTFIDTLADLPALLGQNASGTWVPHSAPS
jgi:phosphoglycolate phosphatase